MNWLTERPLLVAAALMTIAALVGGRATRKAQNPGSPLAIALGRAGFAVAAAGLLLVLAGRLLTPSLGGEPGGLVTGGVALAFGGALVGVLAALVALAVTRRHHGPRGA